MHPLVKQYRDAVKVERMTRVMDLQIHEGLSIGEACDAVKLPKTTFLKWLQDGVLTEYLADLHRAHRDAAAAAAAEALPRVISYMVAIATGEQQVMNASPVAAARFVVEVADSSGQEKGGPTQTTFVPQQVVVMVQGGTPRTDDAGRVVIDATPCQSKGISSSSEVSSPTGEEEREPRNCTVRALTSQDAR